MRADLFTRPRGLYLLSHSVGLLPVSAEDYFAEHFLQPWQRGDEDIWTHWLAVARSFRASIAALLHTEVKLVCPQANVSSALTKILGSLRGRSPTKNTLLLSAQDFPSLGFVAKQALADGLRLQFIPEDFDYLDVDAWSDYLTEEVFAVLLTHVQSNTGVKIPVAALTRIAAEREIFSIVDIAQSAGIVPIDVRSWGADFVIGSSVKWLCGGPGAGFLWVNNKTLPQVTPRDVGWFSHRHPFEFAIQEFTYADDALRYWGGTPSVAPLAIAANSVETLVKIGIEKIAEHNAKCKQYLREHIDAAALVSPDDERHQGGTLIFRRSEEAQNRLRRAAVEFDVRRQGIRISPHIYTPLERLALVCECF